jgi:endo-1,4-beta-mannosidase
MDIEVGSYQKPQEAQIISTIVEYLQGIQTAKEAAAPDNNRSGNLANNDEYFTIADNAHMRCNMCSNALWRKYY